jgi:hypothetical protein
MANANRYLISLSQVEHGSEMLDKLNTILANSKNIDPASYRKIFEKISETDLSPDVRDKLNRVGQYDDTFVLRQIDALNTAKADKADLSRYRLKDTPIKISDLEQALVDKINAGANYRYDDTSLRTLITAKADTSTLSNYRKTADKIQIADLADDVSAKIAQSAPKYDDTLLSNRIKAIEDLNVQTRVEGAEAKATSATNAVSAMTGDINALKNINNELDQRLDLLENESESKVIDTLTFVPTNPTQFILRDIPDDKRTVELEVNGIGYDENDAFTVNRLSKILTWTFTDANGGFDLQANFLIQAKYFRE